MQLQILNAAVKTFLKTQTEESYGILNSVFEFTSKEADNPDLRERGFVYWRLMAIDPNLAAQIILCEKPRISEDVSGYDSNLLDVMVNNLGTLASIYVKPPELFVKKTKIVNVGEEEETDYEENAIKVTENEAEVINENVKKRTKKQNGEDGVNRENNNKTESSTSSGVNLLDLNDILGGGSSSNSVTNNSSSNMNPTTSIDMIGIFGGSNESSLINSFNSMSVATKKAAVIPKQTVLSETQPGFTNKSIGLAIEASLQRENDKVVLYLNFINSSKWTVQDFEIQFNKNYFGLAADPNALRNISLAPGTSEMRGVNIVLTSPDSTKVPSYDPPVLLQTAIRCNLDEYYFTVPIMFCTLFTPQIQKIDFSEYQSLWMNTQAPKDLYLSLNNLHQKYQSDSAVSLFLFR